MNSPPPSSSNPTTSGSSYYRHESAFVDEPCEIGEKSQIWHFSHVMRGARIGRECVLGQNVFVASSASLGDRVRVQNNVSIYDGVTIEDEVFLGPSCVLTNVTNPRAGIKRRAMLENTRLKRGATLGANATILCGVTVGRHAFIGAGAVVTKDVPDYALITGVPGKRTGWMGRHAQKLVRDQRGAAGYWVCPESLFRYFEENGTLRCLDLHEDAPLPPSQATSPRPYARSRA